MGLSSYQIVEVCDALASPDGTRKALVITKAGKYLRGHIHEHNLRVSGDSKVKGRLALKIDGVVKDIEAGDIASVEEIKS